MAAPRTSCPSHATKLRPGLAERCRDRSCSVGSTRSALLKLHSLWRVGKSETSNSRQWSVGAPGGASSVPTGVDAVACVPPCPCKYLLAAAHPASSNSSAVASSARGSLSPRTMLCPAWLPPRPAPTPPEGPAPPLPPAPPQVSRLGSSSIQGPELEEEPAPTSAGSPVQGPTCCARPARLRRTVAPPGGSSWPYSGSSVLRRIGGAFSPRRHSQQRPSSCSAFLTEATATQSPRAAAGRKCSRASSSSDAAPLYSAAQAFTSPASLQAMPTWSHTALSARARAVKRSTKSR
mmetsp:Transcript_136202/g.379699  ORF Transcript_136202/g.379699 Transcript_136202/m.379699 type:complete len:292 (+) Transcript_136202:477-1352(+)